MSSQNNSNKEERKPFATTMRNENETKAVASPTEEKNVSFEFGAFESSKIYALTFYTAEFEQLSSDTAIWESSADLEDDDEIYGLVALDNQLYAAKESAVRLYTSLSVPASEKSKLNQSRRFFGFCAHKDIIVAVGGFDSQLDRLKSACTRQPWTRKNISARWTFLVRYLQSCLAVSSCTLWEAPVDA